MYAMNKMCSGEPVSTLAGTFLNCSCFDGSIWIFCKEKKTDITY